MLENLRLEQIDACIDGVAEGFVHLRLFLEGLNPTLVVADDDSVAAHLILGDALGDQAGESAFLSVASDRFTEIEVDQCIPAQHHKSVVEERLEILDFLQSASGTESVTDEFPILDSPFEAVGDFNTKALAVPEIVFDLFSQVRDVDHHLCETMLSEQFQQKLHHRLLQDRNHWFRDHMRDRLNPCSLARGQDHRLHRRYRLTTVKPT
ncbi:MAG: Uncharacterised protein [Cyanobium sp. ARS6]|nr:MAG: Uncharacterised protein [Cyanobium sp. ARS6]